MKTSKKLLVMGVAAVLTVLQGCATTGSQADNQAQLDAMQQEIDARDQRIYASWQPVRRKSGSNYRPSIKP